MLGLLSWGQGGGGWLCVSCSQGRLSRLDAQGTRAWGQAPDVRSVCNCAALRSAGWAASTSGMWAADALRHAAWRTHLQQLWLACGQDPGCRHGLVLEALKAPLGAQHTAANTLLRGQSKPAHHSQGITSMQAPHQANAMCTAYGITAETGLTVPQPRTAVTRGMAACSRHKG